MFESGVTKMPKTIEQLINRQIRKSEAARERAVEAGKACVNPVITISRGMGSGARIVAQKLADDLGWSLWDRELLDAITRDAHVSRRVVEAFDEKGYSELERVVRSVLGDHEMGDFLYAKHLVKVVAAISKLGNAIILGRGANFVLPKALNIRIDDSFDRRVKNMMSFENLSEDEAIAKVRRSDRERRRFLNQLFGKERVRNARYDLSIWMDEFDTDGAVEIIKAAIKAKYK